MGTSTNEARDDNAFEPTGVHHHEDPPPSLKGQHYRITVVDAGSYLTVADEGDGIEDANGGFDGVGGLSYTGYLIEVLNAIAQESRANFTYTLVTPSGFGVHCRPRLDVDDPAHKSRAYSDKYRGQFNCGTDDVNKMNGTRYATDIYWSNYYVTPERLQHNHMTIPYVPPYHGTPAMYGTTTGIATIEELIDHQQAGTQPPVCMFGSTAILQFVQYAYPDLKVEHFYGTSKDLHRAMKDGKCGINIGDAPSAATFIRERSDRSECLINGKPIGMIGYPMTFGLSQYAFGVGKHVPRKVVDTISYWMNVLMICSPEDPNGDCPEGNFASMHERHCGDSRGDECGYELYPDDRMGRTPKFSKVEIALIVVAVNVACAVLLIIWHQYRLRQQKCRFKKRFVQQIARNIQIGPTPATLSPAKLSQEIQLIGNGKDFIGKPDLAKWMNDIKLQFVSEEDFEALWNAMDIDRTGVVNAVDFIVFLSACGPEFEEVYQEQQKLPKTERLKLAARRLSNIAALGELGVRKLERKLERSTRQLDGAGITQEESRRNLDE